MEKLRVWWEGVLLRLAARLATRAGYALLPEERLERVRTELMDVAVYVERSGHFQTISGRTPRAVRRVQRALQDAFLITSPERLP